MACRLNHRSLAPLLQATLARQLKEAEDRAREQREYDARYAQAEKQQMRQRDQADREKEERRRAKNAREAAARARQVQSARRRHMQHLEQERKRAAAEKARFEYEEAEAEAERVQRILDNKAQLEAVRGCVACVVTPLRLTPPPLVLPHTDRGRQQDTPRSCSAATAAANTERQGADCTVASHHGCPGEAAHDGC